MGNNGGSVNNKLQESDNEAWRKGDNCEVDKLVTDEEGN